MKDNFAQFKKYNKFARVIWYNPAYQLFCGRIVGKGYGCVELDNGKKAFLYGEELGGGLYGENSVLVPKKDDFIYVKSIYIDENLENKAFMGFKYRCKSIDLFKNEFVEPDI